MKKQLLLVLALVVALSLVAAAQVSAGEDKPISGRIDLDLKLEVCPVADMSLTRITRSSLGLARLSSTV